MTIYTGYPGVVWNNVYASMGFFSNQLATLLAQNPVNSSAIALLSEGMLATLLNGTQAINAFALSSAWGSEFVNLESIQALPLTLDPVTTNYFNARVAAYDTATPALAAIVPMPASFLAPSALSNGNPSIPNINMLNFFETFDFEIPPYPSDPILTQANAMATSWANVAIAISVLQGSDITSLYDVAQLESFAAAFAADIIGDFTSGPIAYDLSSGTVANPWNSIATIPAMAAVGATLTSAPFLQANQQQAVLRNVMLNLAEQVQLLLLSLRQPVFSQANLTTVLVGETLPDVAARATGNFENWQAIAVLNGLVPPYTSATPAPGVATWGTQLILPTPGSQLSATGAIPSYAENYLGVDWYIGPINGSMPAWTGDFQTINGYQNLAWALGRRIQTSLGSLIYHTDYGSRIPPEVGNVQTNETAGHIAAFGKAACLADPRVVAVPSAVASLQPGQLIQFAAQVRPRGFQRSIPVNEVLSSLP